MDNGDDTLSRGPGTYILVLRSTCEAQLQVGRLGRLSMMPGWYLYVGSAFGPGGLRARVQYHLRRTKRPRWHIDYLRSMTTVVEVWCGVGQPRRETAWAAALLSLEGVSVPLAGFGASDFRDTSHLVRLSRRPAMGEFAAHILGGRQPGHPPDRLYRQKLS